MMDKTNTTNEIIYKLTMIQKDLSELKSDKVSNSVYEKDLQLIDLKLDEVKKDVSSIQSYGRWLMLLVTGLIITALINLVITTQ